MGALGAQRGRTGRAAWAREAHGMGSRGVRHGLARRAAWALEARRMGSRGARRGHTGLASWASWVLVHPAWFSTWFFDSVVFLSHRFDIVREPGS